jgi:hypothetical protein
MLLGDYWMGSPAMKLFITYASEDRSIADELAVRLRTEGHDVFLDKDSLPESEAYDARIREAIAECDLYLFLVSPNSVKSGRYTRTELKFASEQFSNPHGRVLPVLIAPTPFRDIPAYLGAVTVLQPEGNIIAEVVAEIGKIEARRKRARWLRLSAIVTVLAIAALAIGLDPKKHDEPAQGCRLTIEPSATMAEAGLALDVTSQGGTSGYILGDAPILLELQSVSHSDPWSLLLRGRDGSALGKKEISGCPQSRTRVDFGEAYAVELVPR